MWEEIIFFKKHRVQSIKHLEGWSQGNQMVDSSATAQDVINDQADIDGCQTDHGESKSLQFQIQTQNIGIEFSSVEKVHNEVASVAWKMTPKK